MKIEIIPHDLTVCKLKNIDFDSDFFFLSKTDDEISLVCETSKTPSDTSEREDGWQAFRISGTLDFSLVGILADIALILKNAGISIFAVSTFDTDYILIKKENFIKAVNALTDNGYSV